MSPAPDEPQDNPQDAPQGEPRDDEPTPPAGPSSPTPPYPGAPGISPEPPGYGQPAGPRRLSFGAGVGIGTGIGCGAYVLGGLLAIGLISTGLIGFLIPFVIIAIVGAALMFSARTRPIGTGILIVTAAAWILVLGPCVALLAPGGFT